VHGGAFDRRDGGAASSEEGCARCHTTGSFSGIAEDFDHARWTSFALDGAHAALDCAACHLPEPASGRRLGPVERVFRPGVGRAELAGCTSCHADPHAGRFDHVPATVEDPSAPDDPLHVGCARCHVPESFAEVPAGRFEHGLSTGFVLRGAHEHTSCTACHGAGAAPAEPSIRDAHVPRRLGAVADVFPGAVDQCATCHVDPHGARYDVHAPDLVDGRTGCARCHGEASFHALVTFDHAWTGFALAGSHAALVCAACHPPTAPDATGRIRGAARGGACVDCHADPHGGQFAAAGTHDCARCHAPTGPFTALRFDHDRDSNFELDDVHARLACVACHRPARTRDGRELVRYRPLGTSCADCHGPAGRDK
jgi:hypothetical protein